MNVPEISVLLPVRNAAATIEEAVRSMLTQTFREFELVVVDDGSTDGTAAVLHRLANEDPRVRVITGEGLGLVGTLNMGLRECRGEWIARMDADDVSLPRRLEVSLAALRADPSLAGVGTQVEIFRTDQPVSPNMKLYADWLNSMTSSERLARERFIESPLCHPSMTLRREALERVGGWDEGDFAEDYQLWLKLIDAGHSLRCVPEILFRWRDHEVRLTRTDPRYSEEKFFALKADFLVRGPLRAGRCILWGASRKALMMMRELRARGVDVLQLLEVDPGKIGQRIDGVEVVSWESLGAPSEVGAHLVSMVGAKGAREQIRGALNARGWREGVDYTCAA